VDGTDFERACELADFAATATEPSGLVPWMHLGKALAEYRRERFESAKQWAIRVTSASDAPPEHTQPECKEAAWFIQAAASARLRQLETARRALANGDKTVSDCKLSGDCLLRWPDRTIVEFLRGEAIEAIESTTPR
jgi:hypothetical protein